MHLQSFSRLLSATLSIVLGGIISAAFGYQILTLQEPCPLCFLQRAAMIGVAAGQLLHAHFGIRMSHNAVSILHCIMGGAVSLRQICLHICPGFATFGSPVLGLGLYTWAFIAFVCALVVVSVLMILYDPKWPKQPPKNRFLNFLENFAFWYVFLIIIADFFTVFNVCGLMPCPDNPR